MDIDNNSARRLPPPPPPPPPPRVTATSTSTGGTGVGEKATAEAGAAASMAAEQQRASVVANATALNEERGGAGQNLLGARAATTPAQPSSGTGDVGNVYRDAGATPPSAPTSTSAPTSPSSTTPTSTTPTPTSPTPTAPTPDAQPAAAAAVAGSNDPQGATRALAARAGVQMTGLPMGRANLERRAQQISDDLQSGRTPTAAFGRPTEVSAAERQRLSQADPAARRQLGDEIGRREAQRDSLAQAVGAGNVAKLEAAYASATPAAQRQMATPHEREAAAQQLSNVGQKMATVVNPAARFARLLGPAARQVAQQYNRLAKLADLPTIPGIGAARAPRAARPSSSSSSPRPPRTEAQKERRRELDRLRQEQRMQPPV